MVSGLARHCDNVSGAGYIMEESFVWLTGAKVSTSGWLAPMLVARQDHRGVREWQRNDIHLLIAREQRKRQEGARDKVKPFKVTILVTCYL